MEDNKFWLRCNMLIALVIVSIVLAIGGNSAYDNYVIQKLVEHGAPPLEARCAISSSFDHPSAVCLLLAMPRDVQPIQDTQDLNK